MSCEAVKVKLKMPRKATGSEKIQSKRENPCGWNQEGYRGRVAQVLWSSLTSCHCMPWVLDMELLNLTFVVISFGLAWVPFLFSLPQFLHF
jgi:hypothetical protein